MPAACSRVFSAFLKPIYLTHLPTCLKSVSTYEFRFSLTVKKLPELVSTLYYIVL